MKREREEEREGSWHCFLRCCAGNVSATCCLLPICRDFLPYTHVPPWAPLVIGHRVGGDEGVCKGEGKGCAPVNPKAGRRSQGNRMERKQ